MSNRYKVTVVHGEVGTVYHVVDSCAPEAEQPLVIGSYSTQAYGSLAHKAACVCRNVHNRLFPGAADVGGRKGVEG